MIPRHEEVLLLALLPKVQIDGMPHFTLFDHVHTIYERSFPLFLSLGFFHKESRTLGGECKKWTSETGKVHQVSKVTAVTQYFSLAAAATAKTRIAKSVVTTCQSIHKKKLAFCVE